MPFSISRRIRPLISIYSFACAISVVQILHAGERPNVVFILADDLGIGDVRSYSPDSPVDTPHIDSLASAGMRFTNAHSSNAVCTPTRYSLLTGRYAWRDSTGGILGAHGKSLIAPERLTVAEMLKQKGYSTAAIGKWHLGMDWQTTNGRPAVFTGANVDYSKPFSGGPLDHGFDYYFGDDVINFPPYSYIENNQTIGLPLPSRAGFPFTPTGGSLPGYQTPGYEFVEVMPQITDAAKDYIGQQAATDDPFFLYFSLTAPHTPIVPAPHLDGSTGKGPYGDFIATVDYAVGEILGSLADPNGDGQTDDSITDETIVIFASDNGAQIGAAFRTSPGKVDGVPVRGYKADIYEGGHLVPMLAQWPGHILPEATSDALVETTDFMSTMADIVGVDPTAGIGRDSFSLLPILIGQQESGRRYAVHQSISTALAIREVDDEHEWKLVFASNSGGFGHREKIDPNAPIADFSELQLFDLTADPGETINLLQNGGSPGHRQKALELQKKLQEFINDDLSIKDTQVGDFNRNGLFDQEDITRLTDVIFDSKNYSLFDLNQDSVVDHNDRIEWVEEIARSTFGDSNLDGVFSSEDLVLVFTQGEYEDGVEKNSTWEDGDWDGDKEFGSSDLTLAFVSDTFNVTAVPEPTTTLTSMLLFAVFCQSRRRRCIG